MLRSLDQTPTEDYRISTLLADALVSGTDRPFSQAFYPSDLYDACPRDMALRVIGAPANKVPKDFRGQLTFEIGTGVHEQVQKRLTQYAKAKGFLFEAEVRIDPEQNPWRVSGRCDGVLHVPDARIGVELKTINSMGFGKVQNHPMPRHERQAMLYYGLLKLDQMNVLYIGKDTSAVVEHAVAWNPQMYEEDLTKVEDVLLTLQNGRLPPRIKPDCRDIQCPHRDACWDERALEKGLANETTQRILTRFVPVYRAKFLRAVADATSHATDAGPGDSSAATTAG